MSWRRVGLLVWKELLQVSRDRMMLPLLLLQPLIALLAFGYVVGAEVTHMRLAVLDQDHSVVSERVIESFAGSGYFDLVARADDEQQLTAVMDGNQATVAIEIPDGTGDLVARKQATRIGVIVDGSDGRVAQTAGVYASGIIARLSRELYGGQTAPTSGLTAGVDVRARVLYNPAMRMVNTMVPGLLALVILVSTSMVMSQAVVKERETGTLEQLFVTPISRAEYLIGKLTPFAIIGVLQVFVVFTVGTLWFRVPFRGSPWVMAVGLILFLFCSLGMGLLISLLARTRAQAQQMVLAVQMPQMILSGFMFPLEALPGWLYAVTFAVPLRYILVTLRSCFLKGSGFADLWPQFAALVAFAIVSFLFGLSRFHKQLTD